MKRNILHILWAAAVIPLALASCRQELVPGETDGSHAQPFLITVTDGGYASEATDGSRATENGYTTTFTAGDQCGLYIVRGTEIVYNNICLTATDGTDGSLIWQTSAGTNLGGGLPDEHYFLYYPYQEDMEGNVTVTDATTDDAAFFAPLISGWQPKADQSDYADYTASDLMTAAGTATTNADGTLSLSFPMAHRMAMAVIEMPETVYKFSNTLAVPDYTITLSADFSSENKPCLMSDGSYRYLVNPEAQGEGATIAGSYDDGNREFTITPSIATAGNYKTYKVDGGYKEIEHNLQAGDFYLKDGTLLSKDTPLTDAQKAACAGIVCWVGDATATDPALKRDFPQCTHGLVVSLKETTFAWQNSYASTTIQSWAENQEFYTQGGYYALNKDVGSGYDSPGGIQGYNNTQILKAYNEAFAGSYPVTILDCFSEVTGDATLPNGITSDWYLPSPREMVELYRAKEAVNQSLTASGSDKQLFSSGYWSSGEDSYYSAWFVGLGNGYVGSSNKYNSHYYVRLVFAF